MGCFQMVSNALAVAGDRLVAIINVEPAGSVMVRAPCRWTNSCRLCRGLKYATCGSSPEGLQRAHHLHYHGFPMGVGPTPQGSNLWTQTQKRKACKGW